MTLNGIVFRFLGGSFGSSFAASWGPLGAFRGPLGGFLEPLGGLLGFLEVDLMLNMILKRLKLPEGPS